MEGGCSMLGLLDADFTLCKETYRKLDKLEIGNL
jgi:hypothetical protein